MVMKKKLIAIIVGIVLVGLSVVDFVFLRGDKVFSESGSLNGETSITVPITETGVPNRLVITTGLSARGHYEVAVDWWLVTPDGAELRSESEVAAYRSRSFEFVPETPGEYVVTVQPNYSTATPKHLLDGGQRYRVDVFTNDRQILRPLMQALPF